ncbi:uncharacterized protein link isoform X2 [Eurosta solidaginis]
MEYACGHQTQPAAHRQALYYKPLHIYPAYQIINAQQSQPAVKSKTDTNTESTAGLTFITSTTIPAPSSEPETNSKETIIKSSAPNNTADIALAALELSTDNTIYTPAEFPHDLLEIARTKLGITSLDEVPSISELAEYLGTANAEETINYIRHLTSTEQGVALIKAYLESADFTDRTEESRRGQQPNQQLEIEVEVEPSTQTKNNIFERIAAYFHIYNLWPQGNGTSTNDTRKAVEAQLSKYIKPQLAYRKRLQAVATATHATHAHQASQKHPPMNHHIPLLIRNPLPYHYPIPLRPIYDNRVQSQPAVYSRGHLNTPKFHIPPHIQLARAANIAPQQLQTLLQSKPKLAELAAKVNRLPLTNDHTGQINAQLLAAVKRAVEQDEDLRRLLQSTAETLK